MANTTAHQNIVSCRLNDEEMLLFDRLCEEAGQTRSRYLRCLIRLDAIDKPTKNAWAIDSKSLRSCARELTKWGYHYNQAVHALNAINFALNHGRYDYEWIGAKFDECATGLAEVNDGRLELERKLSELSVYTVVFGD